MFKIYNTFSKFKEDFLPGSKIVIYVCGITVYDCCHIGHARSFLFFDSFIRYLNFLGYKIILIRNITDVDDKILNVSSKVKKSFKFISQKYIKSMHFDIAKLNLIEPTFEPKASVFVYHMLDLIKNLYDKGFAYRDSLNSVYFSLKKVDSYGSLSNRFFNKDHFILDSNDEDFVLWKGDNSFKKWKSFYGYGRPGWHTECAAMSVYYARDFIDIHSGGIDLVFPHHENEFVQTKSSCNKNIVKFWMHIGQVKFKEKKMSKSLNNFVLIKKFLDSYNEEYLRFFMLLTHYKKSINYSDDLLIKTNKALDNLYKILLKSNNTVFEVDDYFKTKFLNSMNDDINTAKAISVLFEILNKIKKSNNINDITSQKLIYTIKFLGNLIGLFKYDVKEFLDKNFSVPKFILNLVNKRNNARINLNWDLADKIRFKLIKLGFKVNDYGSFTSVEPFN